MILSTLLAMAALTSLSPDQKIFGGSADRPPPVHTPRLAQNSEREIRNILNKYYENLNRIRVDSMTREALFGLLERDINKAFDEGDEHGRSGNIAAFCRKYREVELLTQYQIELQREVYLGRLPSAQTQRLFAELDALSTRRKLLADRMLQKYC